MNKYIGLLIVELYSFACLYAKDSSVVYEFISYTSSTNDFDNCDMIGNYSIDHRLLCISKI